MFRRSRSRYRTSLRRALRERRVLRRRDARFCGLIGSETKAARFRHNLRRQGLDAAPGTPAELAERIKRETATWAAVIKKTGIRAE